MGSPSRINDGLRRWQAEWSAGADLAARQAGAVRSSFLAAAALRDHWRAYRDNLNSHEQGVMVVSLLKVLDHLEMATGQKPERAEVDDIFDLLPAVRIAARAAFDRGEIIPAHVTLGELALVSADQTSAAELSAALEHCSAVSAANCGEDLRERLGLFASLGFRAAWIGKAVRILEG
ncbi:MAG TPA: hypothetical protein VL285_26725 [Bryobacteraceae bacterium]|nr:hypothetical protein [Bryobacteraceae bacterium]